MRLLTLAVVWAVALTAAARADDSRLVVALRPTADVGGSQVCVRHVADLSGGTAELRARVGGLDLADAPRQGQPASLLRELVAYRLQLAGIERSAFRMEGPAHVLVKRAGGALTEEDVVAAAREALLGGLPYHADDVATQPVQAVSLPALTVGPRDDLRLDAVPRAGAAVPGRVRIDVTVSLNGERRDVVPVMLDVRVQQMVAVATRRVGAGEALGDANVRFERRSLDAAGSCVTVKDVQKGKRAKRPLAAGQVVLHAHCESGAGDNPVLVKPRDTIKLLARVGPLKVTAVGEAQQEGRAGDKIRVRNVDSKKDLVGRVVERGVVEIEY